MTSAPPSDDTDDAEAEIGQAQLAGKADGSSFEGLYASRTSSHREGDVTALELSGPSYVRTRCYRAGCALPLPETDAFDTYVSASGKTYVRFWSVEIVDGDSGRQSEPRLADVYEIARTTTGIKLRKSYTTRWVTLTKTTPAARCTATGGAWSTDTCACPGNTPGELASRIFVAGAGGCIATPGANESNCDDSRGMWTDDDATLTGAYCICGAGRFDDASGACATI